MFQGHVTDGCWRGHCHGVSTHCCMSRPLTRRREAGKTGGRRSQLRRLASPENFRATVDAMDFGQAMVCALISRSAILVWVPACPKPYHAACAQVQREEQTTHLAEFSFVSHPVIDQWHCCNLHSQAAETDACSEATPCGASVLEWLHVPYVPVLVLGISQIL